MKRKIYITIIASVFFIIISPLYIREIQFSVIPREKKQEIPEKFLLNFENSWNRRQSKNACGPYSTAAVLQFFGKDISGEVVNKNMGYRLKNGYTLPSGITSYLRDYDVEVSEPNVMLFSKEEKISFLKETLSGGSPIILLGRKQGFLHYMSLWGYDENVFYVYDSIISAGVGGNTRDMNGDFPGNVNMGYEDVYEFWSGGGVYGAYRWYMVSVNMGE